MAYNLEPRTIKENLLGLIGKNPHAEPRPANTREECFLADIAENGGGGGGLPEVTSEDNGDVLSVVDGEWSKAPAPSSLPPYTSADKGKGLFIGEGSGSETVVIVPEQTVTVIGDPVLLSNVSWNGISIGDVVMFTMDGTTVSVSVEEYEGKMSVGYEGYFIDETEDGGATFTPDRNATYTVSLTKSVLSVEPKWEAASGGVYSVSLPDDLQTSMMSVFATRMTEAVSAGKGVPCFHAPDASIATSDKDAFDALYSEVQECAENHGIVVLSGGTVCTGVEYDAQNTLVNFLFRYPMFTYSTYTFAIDLNIAVSKYGGLRQYGIGSTMTLINTSGT